MTKLKYYTSELPPFSRRWWGSVLRNSLWVVLITVLIWIYADIEFTDVREFHMTLRLHTAPDRDMILAERREVDMTVKVRGNRSGLDRFQEWLDRQGSVLRYDPSDTYGLGRHPISTAEVFTKFPAKATGGVTVLSCLPSQVDIDLVRAIRKVLPVKFAYTGATEANWEAEPNRVIVRTSEEQWQRVQDLLNAGSPQVLETRTVDLKNVATNSPLTVDVVPTIAGVPVEVDPASVRVTVQVFQRTEKKSLQVAVHVVTPPTWPNDGTWKDYTLVGKDGPAEWQKTIDVSGPKKDVDQLTPAKVQAYVVLTDDDKKPISSWWSREVVVRFPEDLQLKLTGTKPTVNFRLEKRTATLPPP